MRDSGIDVDAVAEHLHRTQAPAQPIPSKQGQPVDFINPVVADVASRLKALQSEKVEGSAVRRLQQVEQELREAKHQLSAAGKGATPTPASASASSLNKRPPSEQLGSTPKKRARPKCKANSEAPSGNLKSLWAQKHDDSSQAMEDLSDKIELFSDDIPEKEKMTKSSRQKNVSARGLQCSKTMFPLVIQILPFQNGPTASQLKRGRQL